MTSKENMRKNNRTYYQRHKEEILKRRKLKREDYKNQLTQAKELIKGMYEYLVPDSQWNKKERAEIVELLMKAEQFLEKVK